ncbi:Protein kinase-like domain [Phytophthora cactorum]|nr:Protein kinase-like domain [Phytophthora cactorum]
MPGPVVYLNNPNACLDYAVGAGGADEFDDAKYVVRQICSDWKDAVNDDITVKIIVGGITNRLYRLVWGTRCSKRWPSVLVRLYGDHTEEFIDRGIENMLFALLSERGFAPTYYGRFKNGRTEPINYLQMIGRELGIMHIMDIPEDRAPKLAMEIELEDPVKNAALEELNLWSVLPSNHNHDGKDLIDDLDTDEITKQAVAFASDVVFSHNDLLSGNILHNPDWDRVQIIDYEYGGYNYRGFDFANHFCENCGFELDLALYPSIEKQFAFFKAYMSTAAPKMLAQLEANRESKAFFHALYDVVNRYALASHLFWGYWALVQAAHSKIDFDFFEYAAKRFNAFDVHREFFVGSS